MSPGNDHCVFRGIRVGEEAVWYPRVDHMRIGLTRVLCVVESVGGGPRTRDADRSLQDNECFGLLEMEMKRW